MRVEKNVIFVDACKIILNYISDGAIAQHARWRLMNLQNLSLGYCTLAVSPYYYPAWFDVFEFSMLLYLHKDKLNHTLCSNNVLFSVFLTN